MKIFFFSAAMDNESEIFYVSKLFTFPGRMLLIRKDSIKKSMICVHPKMHPSKIFETENFRKFSKIFIENYMKMKIFEIENFRNFLISKIFKIFIEKCMKMKIFEIENFRKFSISKIFEGCIFGWTQIIDFFIESFRIKSIRPGNIFPFDFQRDFGLNKYSREIKKYFQFADTESRKLAPT